MKTDNSYAYGSVSRLFHWVVALLYLVMFGSAVAWNINEDLKFLINPHKAVGILLFVLTLLRFIWAISQVRRRPDNTLAAKLGHLALYGLMFAVPALGIIRQIGQAKQVQSLIEAGNQWHGVLAWVLLILIIGHITMTVIHHWRGDKILSQIW